MGLLVENEIEKKIVVLVDECEALEYMVIDLSLREFVNDHHLKKFYKRKVDREK